MAHHFNPQLVALPAVLDNPGDGLEAVEEDASTRLYALDGESY